MSHRSNEAIPASSRRGVEADAMREVRREVIRVRTSETVEVYGVTGEDAVWWSVISTVRVIVESGGR